MQTQRRSRICQGSAARLPELFRRLLVASDGSEDAMGALRLAAALQRSSGARVHAVSACETLPVLMIPAANVQPPPIAALAQLRRQAAAVRPSRRWILSTIVGWPREVILSVAKQWKADAIVVGIGRHRPIDRLLAHETAIAVVRRANVPVLAVAPTVRALPRSAIAAIDFTTSSVEAARLAATP